VPPTVLVIVAPFRRRHGEARGRKAVIRASDREDEEEVEQERVNLPVVGSIAKNLSDEGNRLHARRVAAALVVERITESFDDVFLDAPLGAIAIHKTHRGGVRGEGARGGCRIHERAKQKRDLSGPPVRMSQGGPGNIVESVEQRHLRQLYARPNVVATCFPVTKVGLATA
jgi:hypothetical protein